MSIPRINKMRYMVDILASDAATPLIIGAKASIEDVTRRTGGAVNGEQEESSETTHVITVRANPLITSSCYASWNGVLFVASGLADDGMPLRGRYTQIYARRINGGAPAPDVSLNGGTFNESQSEASYPVDGGTF